MQRRNKILKSSLGVSVATLLSRVLGLGRVMLESRVLGGDSVASAWGLAFAIPNTFRRLLGEGALGTALIPLVSETDAQAGPEQVRRELGIVFSVLSLILALIVAIVAGGAIALRAISYNESVLQFLPILGSERFRLVFLILPLLMPYAFFLCLVGAIGAVLNTRKIFVLPALGALLLNFFLIGGLYVAYNRKLAGTQLIGFLETLSVLVLLSGAIQLLLMLLLLWKAGRFPTMSRRAFRQSDILGRLWRLVLPGMIGGAALQISFLIDRTLAICLGPKAVPALNYVDRIIDLPIGIYAIALGSVLTAAMSRSVAHGNADEISHDLSFSLRHVYFLCIPMAIGVMFFWKPMIRILCLGGNYTEADLMATQMVAIFYGAGIPAFCAIKVLLAPFNARKMMTTTLRYSLIAIACNIGLNLLLMWPLQQGGIALATVLSSMLNNALLLRHLKREGIPLDGRGILKTVGRSLCIALIIGVVLSQMYPFLCEHLTFGVVGEFPAFATLGGLFVLFYFGVSHFCRASEIKELFGVLRRHQ
jgi:putative peptidoglycan lipid II flippase